MAAVFSYREDAFRRALEAKRNAKAGKEFSSKRRMLQKAEILSDNYDKEQAEFREKIDILEEKVQHQKDQDLHLKKLTHTVALLYDLQNGKTA